MTAHEKFKLEMIKIMAEYARCCMESAMKYAGSLDEQVMINDCRAEAILLLDYVNGRLEEYVGEGNE